MCVSLNVNNISWKTRKRSKMYIQ